MPEAGRAGWLDEIGRRAREAEARQQIQYDHARQAGLHWWHGSRLRAGMPALLPDYLKTLIGSMLGFWIITALLAYFFHAKPIYTLAAFGLLYSFQSTYYTIRLAADPTYKIPKCGCAGAWKDSSEIVLRSQVSAMLGIPKSALGAVLYLVLIGLVYGGHPGAATFAVILAVAVSAYLGYVMVVKLAALCTNCINVAALNLLLLWHVLR
jgi:uncharacterized membrane protein